MMTRDLNSVKQFSNQNYINLETYKENGDPVRTPVWVLEDAGQIYVRTESRSWKAKRIGRNPHVRLVASNFSGKLIGDWVEGDAHFIEGDEAARILRLCRKKYGIMGRVVSFFVGLAGRRFVVISITV